MTHPDTTPQAVPAILITDHGSRPLVPGESADLGPATIPLEPEANWSTHLPVNEVFGPVIQGEGPYVGRQASFIRLGGQKAGAGCNLSCPPCDTKPTWDADQYDLAAENPMTFVDQIVRDVGRWNTPLKVISGGEPLLHQQRVAWERLLRGLIKLGMGGIHVETNGTIAPNDISRFLVSHFSVSPKLTSMGGNDPEGKRIKPAALEAFRELADQGHACLKIVCSTEADVEEAAAFADAHGFRREHLWVMPEGDTHDKVSLTSARIGNTAVRMGASFSPRLHLQMGVR
jgi:organic radical activating enzyme